MDVHTSAAYLSILCIFAISSAQGIQRDHNVNGGPGESHYLKDCGNMSSEHSCCNDKLTMGLSHLVAGCCGSVAYNDLNEICCEGKIFTRNSAQEKCCGEVPYLPRTQLCCQDKLFSKKENHVCCDTKPYDKTTHICCVTDLEQKVKLKSESCPKNQEGPFAPRGPSNQIGTPTKVSEFICGSKAYDPKEEICCIKNLYEASVLTKCCGEYAYTPFEDHVLCCNGTLHRNVPKKSECVGDIVYAPSNTTCHLSTRPRLGEHCCGGRTYNPKTHICCNGHSHHKTNYTFCCGSKVYDPREPLTRCCSGQLYNLTGENMETECCGNLLLKYNSTKKCCSSSIHAILYDTKPNHHCCGHYYYNKFLWSCCGEHLQPMPSHGSAHAESRLQPLMDLIPGICNKTVFFGKVESIALDTVHRHIVLKVANVTMDPWLPVSLHHCSSPAVENGMTYLWEKINDVYKPLSISVDPVSDINMVNTVCYHHKCQKGG